MLIMNVYNLKLSSGKMKKQDKLLILLEQWTRADVMSRVGEFPWSNQVTKLDSSCAHTKNRLADEIKTLLYGTCNIALLAKKFGIRGGTDEEND